jgi:Spy/CpxP family protein refolding chaperone
VLAVAAALAAAAPESAAQRGGQGSPPEGRGRGGPRGERLEAVLRRRLGLDDRQVAALRASTSRYGPQRVALARRESALADALTAAVSAAPRDEPRIAGLLDSLFAVRRARLELREREQVERRSFLRPSQRALLLGFEEQAQRRSASFRERRGARAP